MTKNRKATTDAVEILHRRFYEGKPKRLSDLEQARTADELARKIHATDSLSFLGSRMTTPEYKALQGWKKWSERQDSNLRRLGPKPSALARLSYAPICRNHSIA
jgi:hypothetical protein